MPSSFFLPFIHYGLTFTPPVQLDIASIPHTSCLPVDPYPTPLPHRAHILPRFSTACLVVAIVSPHLHLWCPHPPHRLRTRYYTRCTAPFLPCGLPATLLPPDLPAPVHTAAAHLLPTLPAHFCLCLPRPTNYHPFTRAHLTPLPLHTHCRFTYRPLPACLPERRRDTTARTTRRTCRAITLPVLQLAVPPTTNTALANTLPSPATRLPRSGSLPVFCTPCRLRRLVRA